MRTCPCPLEIIPAEPARHVDHLADEIKARHFSRFHGFGGEFPGLDTPESHLSLGVSFRSREAGFPTVQAASDLFGLGLAASGEGLVGRVTGAPSLGKAPGPDLGEDLQRCGPTT